MRGFHCSGSKFILYRQMESVVHAINVISLQSALTITNSWSRAYADLRMGLSVAWALSFHHHLTTNWLLYWLWNLNNKSSHWHDDCIIWYLFVFSAREHAEKTSTGSSSMHGRMDMGWLFPGRCPGVQSFWYGNQLNHPGCTSLGFPSWLAAFAQFPCCSLL